MTMTCTRGMSVLLWCCCVLLLCVVVVRGFDERDIPVPPVPPPSDIEARELWIRAYLRLPPVSAEARQLFGIDEDQSLPLTPDRMSEVTADSFSHYIRRGIPVIITDMFQGGPGVNATPWAGLQEWKLNALKQRFPDEVVKNPHARYSPTDSVGAPPVTFESLDLSETGMMDQYHEHSPHYWSWHWEPIGVRSMSNDQLPPIEVTKAIREGMELPYFLKRNIVNLITWGSRMEFFIGRKGSGVNAHVDDVCEYIFSGQVEGEKHWRIGLSPSVKELERLNPGYEWVRKDGRAIISKVIATNPLYSFTVKEGEVLFFPPGIAHETHAETDVSVSFSLQFSDPQPDLYIRDIGLETLLGGSSGQGCDCHRQWNQRMFANMSVAFGEGEEDETIDEWITARMSEMDTDWSGSLSLGEMRFYFEDRSNEVHNDYPDPELSMLEVQDIVRTLKKCQSYVMDDPAQALHRRDKCEDLMRYIAIFRAYMDINSAYYTAHWFFVVNDYNRDGEVSRDEFAKTVTERWTPDFSSAWWRAEANIVEAMLRDIEREEAAAALEEAEEERAREAEEAELKRIREEARAEDPEAFKWIDKEEAKRAAQEEEEQRLERLREQHEAEMAKKKQKARRKEEL